MKLPLHIIGLIACVSSPGIVCAQSAENATPQVVVASAAKSPKTEVYSLREMMALAYKNADVMKEHTARVDKAKWQEYRADWAWAPKLKSNYLLAPVPEKAEVGEFSSNLDQYLALNIGPFIRVKATVGMPIYTFGKISIAQDLADIGVDVAELERRKARLDVAYQVKRAYATIQLSNAFQ